MPGNKWWSAKAGEKIAVWYSYIFAISNIFCWHSIRFSRYNPSSATKVFNVFF